MFEERTEEDTRYNSRERDRFVDVIVVIGERKERKGIGLHVLPVLSRMLSMLIGIYTCL